MALPLPSLTAYERIVRDASRNELPAGAVWDMVDIIPDFDAPARARGAWANYANAGILRPPLGIGWAEFNGKPAHLVIDNVGNGVKIDASQTVTSAGTATGSPSACSRMVSLNDKLLFAAGATDGSGTSLFTYDGQNTILPVTGGPATAVDVGVYEDFAVAFGDTSVYFSNAGDATHWNTSAQRIGMQGDVIAGGALRNLIIVFCADSIWRIRGSVPPGFGPSNMVAEQLAPNMHGVLDSRTITYFASTCVFANDQGVWQTDGTSLKNITEKFGVLQLWRTLIDVQLVNSAVAWQHRGYYFISLFANGAYVTTLVFDLDRGSCMRMSNMAFKGGAANCVIGGTDDVSLAYQHSDGSIRLGTIAAIFEPQNAGKDANGVQYQPTIETPYIRGWMRLHRKWIPSTGLQTWRNIYLNYDLTGGGQLSIGYTTSMETNSLGQATYVPLPNWSGSLPSTTGRKRVRVPLQIGPSTGLALKLSITPLGANWTSFRFWELETEFYPRETSRV